MAISTEVKIYPTSKRTVKALAKRIYKITKSQPNKKFHIALSGGNSPIALFKRLSKKHAATIPWQNISFWWADERCVPPTDDDSNYKWANKYLLSKVEIPAANIHRIKGENDPQQEAERYAQEIQQRLNLRGGIPVFDLIILGLGDDGHTASIFPGNLHLFESREICAVAEHPVSGQKRVTISGTVINNANRVFFLATGENKASRIAEIMDDAESAKLLPAYHVQPIKGKTLWFMDEAAASKIA